MFWEKKMSSPNKLKVKMQLLNTLLLPTHPRYHKPRQNQCNHFGEGVYTFNGTWPQTLGQLLLISSSITLVRICS